MLCCIVLYCTDVLCCVALFIIVVHCAPLSIILFTSVVKIIL